MLKIGGGVRGRAVGGAFEFPERAEAGQQRGDGVEEAAAGEVFRGERGGVCEDEGLVDFALCDEFGGLPVLEGGGEGEDCAGGGFGEGEVGWRRSVGFFPGEGEGVAY